MKSLSPGRGNKSWCVEGHTSMSQGPAFNRSMSMKSGYEAIGVGAYPRSHATNHLNRVLGHSPFILSFAIDRRSGWSGHIFAEINCTKSNESAGGE